MMFSPVFPVAPRAYRVSGSILCALLLATSCPADEWVIKFAVTEETVVRDPTTRQPGPTEVRRYTQTVALGESHLAVENDRTRIIHDFATRRRTIVHLERRTYEESSLYSLPAFLDHELGHRLAIGAGLRAAGIDQAASDFDRFDVECALRIEARNPPPDAPAAVIETVTREDALEFRHGGILVARYVPSGILLPAGRHRRFVNYLAYSCNIHPRIRQAVAAAGQVPRELHYASREFNKTVAVTLRLLSCENSAPGDSGLPGELGPVARTAGDPFWEMLAAVDKAARAPGRPDRASVIRFADESLAAGRPLDALLALMEYVTQSGDQMTGELRRHRGAFAGDPDCQAYRRAFEQSSKEAAGKSLEVNSRIPREGLLKAHVLELQRANLLERAGRPAAAITALLGVLKANPHHGGALHDIGMIYARGFEESKAWLCWDAARSLYPGHPMMSDVERIEQSLVKNLPDFF